ncbi:MAG: hypothetical protein HLUCCX21_07400, partial [Porphyrobacter sp. HL-46]
WHARDDVLDSLKNGTLLPAGSPVLPPASSNGNAP